MLICLLPFLLLNSSCTKDDVFTENDTIQVGRDENPEDDPITEKPEDTINTISDTTIEVKETVDTVILSRYIGVWYEIASLPQIFEAGCNCTSAEYAPLNENEISVINKCNLFSPSGFQNRIEGKASIVPGSGNAKLLVSFFGSAGADYWILDLDVDYQWAVVGSPDKLTFWILSRTRTIDQTLYDSLLQKWGERGYDVSKVELTTQDGC